MIKMFTILLMGLSFSASATNVVIEYDDYEKSTKKGFFDKTQRTPTADNPGTTVGEARRFVLEYAASMVESQLHSEADIFVSVKFSNVNFGSAATTSSSYTHSEYSNYDEFGILKDGVKYPYIIKRMLQNDSRKEYSATEDPEITFVDYPNNHSNYYSIEQHEFTRFLNLALHELVHVLGFSVSPCFAEYCTQQQSDTPTANSSHIFADSPYNKYWKELTKPEREEVVALDGKIFYYGDDALKNYIESNVVGGHNEQGIMLHSGLTDSGNVSGQSFTHISPFVESTELMKSRVGNTTSFGAAAYILCDMGWCRDKRGWVTDFELSYAPLDEIKPDELVYLSYTLSNPSDKALKGMFVDFELTDSEHTDKTLLPESCEMAESVVTCDLGVLEPHQQVDLDIPFMAPLGTYPIFAKAYSKSYVVDIDGFNNVNHQQVQVGALPFPDITIASSFSVNEGQALSIIPEFDPNESLSFDWAVIDDSGINFEMTQNPYTGELSFTAPDVEQDTSITLNLIANYKNQQQAFEVEITIVTETETETETENNSTNENNSSTNQELTKPQNQAQQSGGSMSYIVFLFLGATLVVRKKLQVKTGSLQHVNY
ncbi:hypothetical protein AT00_09305 [Pseudoalteromonas lipolytica SCSIO 04301]|uniref:hypothetical protein n=1 Tax=Pseudoalteromonas lipolytica TaxID=570156 RepID=UPI00044AA5BC|nr:hypothetical protein [Pseudoalteromonas lipolytica]EWH06640.1 hypothetical protein AT00_09305 [Pseudoalteromonas lipolytica SCSIO 04301]